MKLLTYGAFDVQQVPLQMHLSSEFSYVLCIYHQESVFANNLHLYLHIYILSSHLEFFFCHNYIDQQLHFSTRESLGIAQFANKYV